MADDSNSFAPDGQPIELDREVVETQVDGEVAAVEAVQLDGMPLGEGELNGTLSEALEWHAPVLARVDKHETIPFQLQQRVQRGPRRPLAQVKHPITGDWHTVTAGEFSQHVGKIAQGLIGMGLEMGDRVAIMAHASYDWMLLDFASWSAGLVPVPIYETSSKDQIQHILKDAEIKLAVTEDVVMANLVQAAADSADADVRILSLDQGAMSQIEGAGAGVAPREVAARSNQLTLDSIATIVYTSGTTGTPKGAVISHGNFTDLNKNCHLWMPEACHPGSRMLLFLPPAHILARFLQVYVATGDGCIGHASNIKTLLPDLASFKPTFLLVVPRVLEKIYNSADAKAGKGIKKRMFRWAAKVAVEYSKALDTEEGPSRRLKADHAVATGLVLGKMASLVGGNVEIIISGGAPLSDRLAHFYRAAKLPVMEGYGLTETTGPLSVNTTHLTKIGTVGPPVPPMRVRVSDGGELLVKGPAVFQGYNNQPELTAEAFDADGWFRTGDLGSIDRDGYVRVTGRAKEVIVTAGGKNVIPTTMEDALRGHPLISQVLVVGEGRPFIGALVTLDDEMLPLWLENKGLPRMSAAKAAQHPEVRASISQAIERTNEGVSRAESIRKFDILLTDFTEANGLMTPSMKMKRAAATKRHAADIDRLYGGPISD